jgi:hypothetical protein
VPEDLHNIFSIRIDNSLITARDAEHIICRQATGDDYIFSKLITDEMHCSALVPGCGISKRSPLSIIRKMIEGKAINAVTLKKEWVGFPALQPTKTRN